MRGEKFQKLQYDPPTIRHKRVQCHCAGVVYFANAVFLWRVSKLTLDCKDDFMLENALQCADKSSLKLSEILSRNRLYIE